MHVKAYNVRNWSSTAALESSWCPFLDEVVCAVFDAIESFFSSFLSLSLKKQAA
jgi:hypothetical protein